MPYLIVFVLGAAVGAVFTTRLLMARFQQGRRQMIEVLRDELRNIPGSGAAITRAEKRWR